MFDLNLFYSWWLDKIKNQKRDHSASSKNEDIPITYHSKSHFLFLENNIDSCDENSHECDGDIGGEGGDGGGD